MRLEDFRREFPAIARGAEVETMGGLLTHLLGVVPDAQESAIFSGLKLTAQVTDGRRVKELLVQASEINHGHHFPATSCWRSVSARPFCFRAWRPACLR